MGVCQLFDRTFGFNRINIRIKSFMRDLTLTLIFHDHDQKQKNYCILQMNRKYIIELMIDVK